MIHQIDETKFPGRVVGLTRRGASRKGRILAVVVRQGDYMLLCGPDGEVRERTAAFDGRGRQMLAQTTEEVHRA